jgi:hypothetical protein
MKSIKLLIWSTVIFLMIGCTTTNNPLSSDTDDEGNNYNDTILFDTVGHGENG